jgi:hypothetical protein
MFYLTMPCPALPCPAPTAQVPYFPPLQSVEADFPAAVCRRLVMAAAGVPEVELPDLRVHQVPYCGAEP